MGTVRLCFSAINGTGLGHLKRQVAIAREAAGLLEALDLKPDFRVITTSDAPQAAGDFPVYKLPSPTAMKRAGGVGRAYVAEGRLVCATLMAAWRPDVLVMDTRPEGAFREYVFIRDHARASVFIDRHADPSPGDQAARRAHLALYDRILVPDDPGQAHRHPLPGALAEKRRFVGRVHGYRPDQALDREGVRARFGLPEEAWIIYVSAGGGGDPEAQADLDTLIDALLSIEDAWLLVGYGPLYRGRRRAHPRVVALTDPEISPIFGGLDAAFSAAGYNSREELLAAGVPSAFFAQTKGLDRQDERIALGVDAGWHLGLPTLEPATIHTAARHLRHPDTLHRLMQALADRPPAHGALWAAHELLSVCADQGRGVEAGPLGLAAAIRALDLKQPQATAPAWPGVVQTLLTWWRATEGAGGLDRWSVEARARTDLWREAGPRWLRLGRRLTAWHTRIGLDSRAWARWLSAYSQAGGGSSALERRLLDLIDAHDAWIEAGALTDHQAGDLLEGARQISRATDLAALLDALIHPDHPPPCEAVAALVARGEARGLPLAAAQARLSTAGSTEG